MYVSDSLFFIQHLFTNKETDEECGRIFTKKIREIFADQEEMKYQDNSKQTETAEDIRERMIKKSEKLSGTKL